MIKNRKLRIRVEQTSILHFEGALLIKKFAELEKNLKMKMTKQNHFYIVIIRSLYLNVSLGINLAVPLDVFNKIDT